MPSRGCVSSRGEVAQHGQRLQIVLVESAGKLPARAVRIDRLRRRHGHHDVVGDEQELCGAGPPSRRSSAPCRGRPAGRDWKRESDLTSVLREKGSAVRDGAMVSLSRMQFFDVVVIGAGHAAVKPHWPPRAGLPHAAASLMSLERSARCPATPPSAETAKGHLVRESTRSRREWTQHRRAAIQFKTSTLARDGGALVARAV